MICPSPITLIRPTGNIVVPCGSCLICQSNKAKSWTIRLTEELRVSSSAHFITLTYNDENVHKLDKPEIQRFLKRIRQFQARQCDSMPDLFKTQISSEKGQKIRYYIVGEYGTRTKRPHYHGIFFNLNSLTINHVPNIWEKGFTHIGQVNPQTISYTLKYLVIPKGENPTFTLMSKVPPLGYTYIEKLKEWHLKGKRFYSPGEAGTKKPMPRIYKEKIFSKAQRKRNARDVQSLNDENYHREFERLTSLGEDYFQVLQGNIEKKKIDLQKSKKTRLL